MEMSYNQTLTIRCPIELADTAAAIGRALDPDTGGDKSFLEVEGELVASTRCTEEFKAQAIAMLSDPAMLHGAVSADYASRWADLVPPTLAECQSFCAVATIDMPVQITPEILA
jgi:hypothetical protein